MWFQKQKKYGLKETKKNKLVLITQNTEDQGLGTFPYEYIFTEFNDEGYFLPSFLSESGLKSFCSDIWSNSNMGYDTFVFNGETVYAMVIPAYCFTERSRHGSHAFFHITCIGELQEEDRDVIERVWKILDL